MSNNSEILRSKLISKIYDNHFHTICRMSPTQSALNYFSNQQADDSLIGLVTQRRVQIFWLNNFKGLLRAKQMALITAYHRKGNIKSGEQEGTSYRFMYVYHGIITPFQYHSFFPFEILIKNKQGVNFFMYYYKLTSSKFIF